METLLQIEQGVYSESVQQFQKYFHLTAEDMALLLVLSRKGYYNLLERSKLNKQQSERFLSVKAVYEQALDTLENVDNVKKWMHTYHAYLKRTPFDILDTFIGCEEIRNELVRLEHGIVS